MSVIAQAIADRQSEIDRLQAEIKALTDDPGSVNAAGALHAAALFRAEEDRCRRHREQVRGHSREEAPEDVRCGEESGIRADDRLLGGTAEEDPQEVAGTPCRPS